MAITLFGGNKQKEPVKRTVANSPKRHETSKDVADRMFATHLKRTPELAYKVALNGGDKLPQKLIDEIFPGKKKPEEEIQERIDAIGLSAVDAVLEQDADMKMEVGRALIAKQLGPKAAASIFSSRRHRNEEDLPFPEYATNEDPGYGGYMGGDPNDIMTQMDRIDALKERLGVSKSGGFMEMFKDPEVIMSLISMVTNIMGKGAPQQPQQPQEPSRLFVVSVNGQPQAVTEQEYINLEKQGRLKPLAIAEPAKAVIAPAPAPAAVAPPPEEPPSQEVSVAEPQEQQLEPVGAIDWDDLYSYMQLGPRKFVDHLHNLVEAEPKVYTGLWMLLHQSEYAYVVEFFKTEIMDPGAERARNFICKAENKKWLTAVLKMTALEK